MQRILIYIDGTLADLSPITIVATTLQAMPVTDIKKRVTSYTNRFKLPPTATNNRIFEHANNHTSRTRKPYTNVAVRFVQNGIEIWPHASGVLYQSGESGYELNIFDEASEFSDAIKGKYVDELDLELYGPFDDDFIDNFKNDITPGGCPVIDYGRMLIPEVELTNKNFDAKVFDPWENPDDDNPHFNGGPQWETSTGDFIGVTLATTAPNNISEYLHGPYNFRKGIQYRIYILCEVISGSTDGSLQVELHNDGDVAALKAVGSQAINSTGEHVFDQTVTADDDYPLVAIIASQLLSGTSKEVILKAILIQPIHNIDVKAPYYLPVLSYADTINKIITNAGFTWNTSVFEAADLAFLSNLAITFSKPALKYNARLLDKYTFIAHATGSQVIAAIPETPLTVIEFTDIEKNGSEEWYDSSDSGYHITVLDFDLRIKLFIKLTVDVTALAGSQINFFLTDGAILIDDEFGFPVSKIINSTGEHTFVLELPATVIGSQARNYQIKANSNGGGTNSVEILSGTYHVEVDNTPVGRVHASNLILPDMLQSDFFADFLYRFGCMFNGSRGRVVTKPLERIIEDRLNAIDWTTKRDKSFPETITYIYRNYGQRNYLSDEPDTNPAARGVMEIDNQQMDEEKHIYTSPFKLVDHINVDNIRVCRIPVFGFERNDPLEASEDFNPGVRLVVLRGRVTTDPEVEYNGVVSTSHLVAVYDDPRVTVRANWQYFLDHYYRNLKTNLDKAQIITRSYRLNEIDISTLDLMRLIFDNGAYFKIETIENYIPGRSTKVRMFKVS